MLLVRLLFLLLLLPPASEPRIAWMGVRAGHRMRAVPPLAATAVAQNAELKMGIWPQGASGASADGGSRATLGKRSSCRVAS